MKFKTIVISLFFILIISKFAIADEIRAYWADAYHNGFFTAEQADNMLATVRASNMNTIMVQMRRRGGTYYPSSYEPFETNADTSFDALAYLIEKAHSGTKPIKVHAWFATYPLWGLQNSMPSAPNHLMNTHSDWLTEDISGEKYNGSSFSLDPGVPGVSEHITNMIVEVVRKYDVDGIHFDYPRYTSPSWGYNSYSVARFNALHNRCGIPSTTDADWLQFRRDQITQLVRRVYASVNRYKPSCLVSAVTIAWSDAPSNDVAWLSSNAYSKVLQDWRGWTEEGILDVVMPMIYFDDAVNSSYFNNWCSFLNSRTYNRAAVVCSGGYLNSADESYNQLVRTKSYSNLSGQGIYSYAVPYINGTAAAFGSYLTRSALYPSYVQAPTFSWKSNPTSGHIMGAVRENGKVVDGATVTLSGTSRTCKTDSNGYFAFIDVPAGSKSVVISAVGCNSKTNTVAVSNGRTVYTFVSLTPVSTAAPAISNMNASDITYTSAVVSWNTNTACTKKIELGTTTSYGKTITDSDNYTTLFREEFGNLQYATTYHYRITATNKAGLTTVSADKTFTTAQAPTEIIIDNLDASISGSWSSGSYGGAWPTSASQYYSATARENSVTAACTWTPMIAITGKYDVYCWYNSGTNRTSCALYTINHANGSTQTTVNQQINGSKWNLIASGVKFESGTGGNVYLTNSVSTGGGVIIADAVRFVCTQPDEADPIMGWLKTPMYVETRTNITASWQNTGAYDYKYAIGTIAGATNVVGWTSTSGATSFSVLPAGSQISGRKVYVSVKAVTRYGKESDVVISPVVIYATPYATLTEMFAGSNAKYVMIKEPLTVSAVFSDCCYLQNGDGTKAIKAEGLENMTVGDVLHISGYLKLVNGERLLSNCKY